ncbi:TetR/AcrR family transcriptional regulator [Clostridium sp. DL1XJH146]
MKQYAKTAILNSFKTLLREQCIDKITVKRICEHGAVNRQTFYYYYPDIRAIFKYMITEELFVEIAQNRTIDTWQNGFLATMYYLKKNSKMILHIYYSSYCHEANAYFVNFSNKLLNDVVEECAHKANVPLDEKDKMFIVNFYTHAFNGLMLDWLVGGMDDPPEVILRKLLLIIKGNICHSVIAFAKESAEENLI